MCGLLVQKLRTRSRQRGGNAAHEEEERKCEEEEGRGEGEDDHDRALTECDVVDQLANRKLLVWPPLHLQVLICLCK